MSSFGWERCLLENLAWLNRLLADGFFKSMTPLLYAASIDLAILPW